MLLIILLGMIYLFTNKIKKSNLFGGCLFSNITKVKLLISNTQSCVPINLCKISGGIHLFRIRGGLTPENTKLKKNWIWGVIEIDWKGVNMTLNGNDINLPSSVILQFRDKYRVRELFRKQPLVLHVMLKLCKSWFTLEYNNRSLRTNMNRQNVISLIYHFILETMSRCLNTNCDFDAGFLMSDIPRDTLQVVLKIKMKWTKHTLTKNHEKRTKKY